MFLCNKQLVTLAVGHTINKDDNTLLSKANLALNYWLDHDFTEKDCIDKGGKKGSKCSCGTPGLWNKNWYDQEIAVPRLIGRICLLMKDGLTMSQISGCNTIMSRAFAIAELKNTPLTGANLLDVSSIGISLGLLNKNLDILTNALRLFYSGVKISDIVAKDGIQSDGSFMQHNGLLYNGNYGKDYINDLLDVFIETKNTALAPSPEVQRDFETLIEGTEWMIIADTKLGALLWQYSVIGRMISFRYSDRQASGGVKIEIASIAESTEGWENEEAFKQITGRLQQPASNANQGQLIGTRYFYNSDYMVHRTANYVVTMKMYSSRTVNSECLNVQNPFGFHLSDGAIFNYLNGDEYRDAFVVWNWNLIPGITVNVGGTALTCTKVKTKGKKDFVGGATDDNTGITVFDYLNPTNGHLSFKKTVFFFSSAYAIQLGSVQSINSSSPLVTVLDQRLQNGNTYINGKLQSGDIDSTTTQTRSIWHSDIGYYFPQEQPVYVESKKKVGNWSTIGISKGKHSETLWTSYIEHSNSPSPGLLTQYIVQPGVQESNFHSNVLKKKAPIDLDSSETPQVNAAYSEQDETIAIAFWTSGQYTAPWKSAEIYVDNPCVVLLKCIGRKTYRITVADPSQKLTTIGLSVKLDDSENKNITVNLPNGILAGKAIVQIVEF